MKVRREGAVPVPVTTLIPATAQRRNRCRALPTEQLYGCTVAEGMGEYVSEGGGEKASRFQPSAATARNPPAPQSAQTHRPWLTDRAAAPPHRRSQPAEPSPSPTPLPVSESAHARQDQGFLDVSKPLSTKWKSLDNYTKVVFLMADAMVFGRLTWTSYRLRRASA